MKKKLTNVKIDKYYACHQDELPFGLFFKIGGKGNHIHTVYIEGKRYYFRAGGNMKWIYKRDTVSFEYMEYGTHNEIDKMSIRCVNTKGEEVQRGSRIKPKLYRNDGRSKRDGYKAD